MEGAQSNIVLNPCVLRDVRGLQSLRGPEVYVRSNTATSDTDSPLFKFPTFWCELKDAYSRGFSLLIYQHFPRVVRERFVPFTANRLGEEIGSKHVAGFQTSHVAFLLAMQPKHVEALTKAISELQTCWDRQIEVWYSSGRLTPVRTPPVKNHDEAEPVS